MNVQNSNCNKSIYGQFIGQTVVFVHSGLHIWRKGLLVDVQEGCNGLLVVRWENQPELSYVPPQDCALAASFPFSRWERKE